MDSGNCQGNGVLVMAFWTGFYGKSTKKKGKEIIKVEKVKNGHDTDYDDYEETEDDTELVELREKVAKLQTEIETTEQELERHRKMICANTEFLQKVIMELINKKPEEKPAPPKMTVADYLAKKSTDSANSKKLP